MGCTTSKLDDSSATALCRDRCGFLEAAIHQRYALAQAHVAYTQSLTGIGHSLHQFINYHHGEEDEDDSDSSKIAAKPKLDHSDSDSGHLVFDSDSSDDIDSLHSSPLHHHLDDPSPELTGSYLHMNYMKKSSVPSSVVYERPSSPQRVYFGESSTSNYNPYPNSSNPYFENPNYGPGSLKPPPQPPSPPKEKVWDFLNPFDSYYTPYTPSRDSIELRKELYIPDLEEDEEVVKEVVHGKQKLASGNQPKPVVVAASVEERPSKSIGGNQASMYQTKPSVAVEKEEKEHEVHVVEKKVVEDDGCGDKAMRRSNGEAARGSRVRRGMPEIAKEIEAQFLRAAESGSEIAVMLEVGKHPYGCKNVSSKKLHEVSPSMSVVSSSSQPSTSKKSKAKSEASSSVAAPTYEEIVAELALRSRNLSSTLHKLHLWEKKLYEEVKAEEKLRIDHEKKLRKLRRLDERGAENEKVNSSRKLVRSMSSKIRIAIQVIDKISVTINKIRDEELWLQLNKLIQGLSTMWKFMLECHQSQSEAIKEARGLGPIGKLGDNHLEATRTLGHDLINWIVGFSSWVSAQRGFVRELNSWLMKCLIYEPEETADGIVPFSPGRIGAPVIFVICNQWEQAMDRISEREVVEAMRRFTTSVLHLWEQDRHGDPRNVDREEQRIQQEIQELERKVVMVGPGEDNSVYQSDTSNESLKRVKEEEIGSSVSDED